MRTFTRVIKFKMNASRGMTDERGQTGKRSVARWISEMRGAKGIIKKLVGDFAHPSGTSSPRRKKRGIRKKYRKAGLIIVGHWWRRQWWSRWWWRVSRRIV